MMTVTHRHARDIGYCNRGLRMWFARVGLDWADFLKNGIAADTLRKHNNAMVERVIARAEKDGHG